MNEQRKVIYARRQQVIDGEDIHDATIVLLEEVLTNFVEERLEGRSPRSGTWPVWSTNCRSTRRPRSAPTPWLSTRTSTT